MSGAEGLPLGAVLGLLGSGWGAAGALGAVLALRESRARRRDRHLGEALHELRRPLHAAALSAAPAGAEAAGPLAGSLDLARAALADAESALAGAGPTRRRRPVQLRSLAEAAIARWRVAARSLGGGIDLRWRAGSPWLLGDPGELSQALDNLLVNALEHGGPAITVDVSRHRDRVRIAVSDRARPRGGAPQAGGAAGASAVRPRPGGGGAGIAGAGQLGRGHGLSVVRRVAAAHGGRFALDRGSARSVAVLELPLARRNGTEGPA